MSNEIAPRLATTIGVVLVDSHPEPVIYHLVEAIDLRSEPYHAGGTVTHKIPTGRYRISAVRYLGRPPLQLDAAIEAAVREDCVRRGTVLV